MEDNIKQRITQGFSQKGIAKKKYTVNLNLSKQHKSLSNTTFKGGVVIKVKGKLLKHWWERLWFLFKPNEIRPILLIERCTFINGTLEVVETNE